MVTEQENDKKTDSPQKDWVDVALELSVGLILYFTTAFLFMRYVMRQLPNWFCDIRGLVVIISPAIGWFVFMKYSKLLDLQRRRILTILIVAFSGAILSVWLLLNYIGRTMSY
jgi:hypothetical protein